MTNIKAPRFNPSSPDFQENLYTIYQKMRQHQCATRIGKTWVLTRYQDVSRALKDNALVSSGIPEDLHDEMDKLGFNVNPSLRDFIYGIILFEDGHSHKQHRRVLQAAFSGESWAAFSDMIYQESQSLVAATMTTCQFDGITDLAAPLWKKLFYTWLNLPHELQQIVEQEQNTIRLMLDPSSIDKFGLQRLTNAISRLDQGFNKLARSHRKGYDSIFYRSLLKGYGGDENMLLKRFSTDCITILLGGSETSEALTGNLLYILTQHPKLQEDIRSNRLKVSDMVNEVMRFESPLQMTRRKVITPANYMGREFKVGDNVLLCLGAANRDETVFEDAWKFNPNRKNSQRHLGFGVGTHRCIGQMLAQSQAESLALALCVKRNYISRWSGQLVKPFLDTSDIRVTPPKNSAARS
ncbi:cytochrome P450 [Vibrio parahaemolyticus]|nr:cytochrome P450 [Vibrio parahaemolyticus]EGR2875451.1 cytochrome P450 [Vibrio parahaemolyticus]EJC7067102.1 cytochrome P450 [Vibrio parahaemolyticus]EJF9997022.1 cytochrome P450 [Vibrio parahaemolyticus]EJG0200955.1 cytochrome P450 [Vibrio parahaemolyticus]